MHSQSLSPIVSLGMPNEAILSKPAKPLKRKELEEALQIGQKLIQTANSLPHPVAGLAAPQIGINRRVFVYSFDRKPEHLEMVVNPTWEPVGEEMLEGWEGCISVIPARQVAKVQRYKKIFVTYISPQLPVLVKAYLEGFAAKVFQHECDHLKGVLNIQKENVEVSTFKSDEELQAFMKQVRQKDAQIYHPPTYLPPARF
jgi:peptide deformylase